MESGTGLVGLDDSFDFAISAEQEWGDLASLPWSTEVVLLPFDLESFRMQLWLRNILSNCSFCAVRAASSFSRESLSEFNSSLSYRWEEKQKSPSAKLFHEADIKIRVSAYHHIEIQYKVRN